jgi:TonB-dependent starch-binding outer membrane protein SusC
MRKDADVRIHNIPTTMRFTLSLLLILVFGWTSGALAQIPVSPAMSLAEASFEGVDRNAATARVTLSERDARLGDVLDKIGTASGLRITYSSDIVPVNQPVSVELRDVPVMRALQHVLGGSGVGIRPTSGGHVVLVREQAPARVQVQTGSIEGVVRDGSTRESLPGANVLIPGTQIGASTDVDGRYSIASVPAGTYTLEARFIGYRPMSREVTVMAGETVVVNFDMGFESLRMDEVVVTGTAGDSRRRTVGNAVSRVDAAAVNELTASGNITELMQARTPGMTLLPGSGTAGAAASIRLRGASSMTGSSTPVVFIDGVRMNSGSMGNFNAYGQGTSMLESLNPEDIQSIEVIKGPAAATLYGAEAAAGVIQIITKRGRMGQRAVQFGATLEMGQNDWAVERPTNYAICTQARIDNPSVWVGCVGRSAGDVITHVPLSNGDALRSGAIRRLNLTAQGGGDAYSFYLSGSTDVDEGVFHNNFSNRQSMRGNFGFFPSERLTFNVNLNYANSHVRLPLNDDIAYGLIISSWLANPGQAYNFPGDVGYFTLRPEVSNQYDNQTRTDRFIVGASADWRPLDWLTNRFRVGYDHSTGLAELYYAPDQTGRSPFGPFVSGGYIGQAVPRSAVLSLDYDVTAELQLSRDIVSNTSLGIQYVGRQSRRTEATGQGLGTGVQRSVSAAAVTSGSFGFSEVRSLGMYLQEQVGWRDRLFGTAAVRMDNHSAFGSDIEAVLYPKLSVSYVISEEDYFGLPVVDDLRLRAAWGQAGNAPTVYSADRRYTTSVATLENGTTVPALRYLAFGNPGLKPERANEFEIGFDASLLDGLFDLEATYYNARTRDAMMSVPVAPSTGFSGNTLENLGTIANEGIEVVLTAHPIRAANARWEHTFAFSANRNELVSFGDGRDPIIFGIYAPVQRYEEGYSLGAFWARPVLYDEQGNLVRNAAGNPVLDDPVYMGPSVPPRELTYSTTLTLFNNLRVFAMLDYKGGHYQFNVKDWRRDRARLSWETVNPEANPDEVAARMFASQTFMHVQPADFLKLRDVSLSYTVPGQFVSDLGISRATLTLSGHNLAVLWTRYGGADPEVNFHGPADFSRVDSWTMPMIRRLSASLRVNF